MGRGGKGRVRAVAAAHTKVMGVHTFVWAFTMVNAMTNAMTNATAKTSVAVAARLFPALFAVWRPSLGRLQMITPVRLRDGSITGFSAAWGPWVSASVHSPPAPRAQRQSFVRVGAKDVSFYRTDTHISVWMLDERDVVMQRIPVLEFDCWRRLPRTCI